MTDNLKYTFSDILVQFLSCFSQEGKTGSCSSILVQSISEVNLLSVLVLLTTDLFLSHQVMSNSLQCYGLPLARLLGICLGGQVEGFLPLPLPALVFLGQAGAD